MYYSPSSVKAVTGAHNIFRNETTQSRFNLVDIKGNLYIIPSSISDEIFIPTNNLEIINSIDNFIVENIKVSLSFLKKVCPEKKITNENFKLLEELKVKEEKALKDTPVFRKS